MMPLVAAASGLIALSKASGPSTSAPVIWPRAAITVSAALSGSVDVAVGNLLGGIALQTVVLVALDAFSGRHKPLTYSAASLTLVLEAALVVAVLLVVVAGRRDRTAGWLLLPYLAWVGFAGVLNWSVARLNAPGA